MHSSRKPVSESLEKSKFEKAFNISSIRGESFLPEKPFIHEMGIGSIGSIFDKLSDIYLVLSITSSEIPIKRCLHKNKRID